MLAGAAGLTDRNDLTVDRPLFEPGLNLVTGVQYFYSTSIVLPRWTHVIAELIDQYHSWDAAGVITVQYVWPTDSMASIVRQYKY